MGESGAKPPTYIKQGGCKEGTPLPAPASAELLHKMNIFGKGLGTFPKIQSWN